MTSQYYTSTNPYWTPVELSTVSRNSKRLWDTMICRSRELGLALRTMECGAQFLDCGRDTLGSYEAGRLITELCQGGLARASLNMTEIDGIALPEMVTESWAPAAACMDMQMGLPFTNSLLSGPYRLFVEPLRFVIDDIPLSEATDAMVALIEPYADAPLFSEEDALELARMGNINPKDLKIVYAPAASLAGSAQVSGRASEDVLLTIHRSLLIDSAKVVNAVGRCGICPHYPEELGLARLDNDDFLHYAAQVYLAYYSDPGEDVQKLADDLVFCNIDIYGTYWCDLLTAAGGDFFRIPNITDINRIGTITINDLRTGTLYTAGQCRPDLILARLLRH